MVKLKVSCFKIIGWLFCCFFLIGLVGDGWVFGWDLFLNFKWCINSVEVFEFCNGCFFWDWSRGVGKKLYLYNW